MQAEPKTFSWVTGARAYFLAGETSKNERLDTRVEYVGYLTYKVTYAVTLQPLVAGHNTIHHMKAFDVPFHMGYGRLICSKRLQSDRPEC